LGYLGLSLSIHTKHHDFTESFRKAAEEAKLSGHIAKPPINGAVMASYACTVMAPASSEDIERFIHVIGEIVPYAARALGGCLSGTHELARGEFAFFKGELEEAEKRLLESLVKSREAQQYEIENRALFYLLRIYLSRMDAKRIKNVFEQLKAELEKDFYLNRYFYHDIVTGWYYIQTGRQDRIASWLKSDFEESGLNYRVQGLEKLVKAKYYFAEKRYPAALAVMENQWDGESFLMGTIEMKVLEAACRYRSSDKEGAFKALGEAYRLAAPAGLFMPFVELGKDMRALAEAAEKDKAPGFPPQWLEETRRKAAVYAKKLYPQIERASGQTGHGKGSPLSHRETEVLTGLSQGLTREEIAGAASISPNTVKCAVRSIYNKLGALNQADAVRIATEKGILS
jgi:LuxR family maltose regulon positive regulatory protein